MPKTSSIFARPDLLYPWALFLCLFLIASLIMAVPWPVFHFNVIMPNLALIVLFVWVLLRPELCHYSLFFIAGLWTDMLLSLPLGVHAFCNVMFLHVMHVLRVFIVPKNFPFIGLSFAGISFAYMAIGYLLGIIFFGLHLNFSVFAMKWGSTVLTFPLLFSILLALHREVVRLSSLR